MINDVDEDKDGMIDFNELIKVNYWCCVGSYQQEPYQFCLWVRPL